MQKTIKNKIYDVVIAGGGTSGVAAAYIAAKNGLKTLLVERNSSLGGSMTNGLVVPMMKTAQYEKNSIFYNDFIKVMQSLNGQHTYNDGNDGWINPELAKIALDKMLYAVGCDVFLNSDIISAKESNHTVLSVEIMFNGLLLYVVSRYFIDATGDGNFSEILNCKKIPSEKNQSLTLRFLMSGVNIEKFADYIEVLDKDETVTTVDRTEEQIHLSTAYTWDNNKDWALRPIFERAINDGIIKEDDSAYFQIFTVPGMYSTIAFNCPRIVSEEPFDVLNPIDYYRAISLGREKVYKLANFCIKYLPGFEKAYISNIANMLGVRESRRIEGLTEFSVEKSINGNYDNDETALITDYPIDIHSDEKDNSVLQTINSPYKFPVSALKSCEYKNLYVIGRCVSADFNSQASLRIQKNCFSMGEAAAKDIGHRLNKF